VEVELYPRVVEQHRQGLFLNLGWLLEPNLIDPLQKIRVERELFKLFDRIERGFGIGLLIREFDLDKRRTSLDSPGPGTRWKSSQSLGTYAHLGGLCCRRRRP
jgi:hypothetical protein